MQFVIATFGRALFAWYVRRAGPGVDDEAECSFWRSELNIDVEVPVSLYGSFDGKDSEVENAVVVIVVVAAVAIVMITTTTMIRVHYDLCHQRRRLRRRRR